MNTKNFCSVNSSKKAFIQQQQKTNVACTRIAAQQMAIPIENTHQTRQIQQEYSGDTPRHARYQTAFLQDVTCNFNWVLLRRYLRVYCAQCNFVESVDDAELKAAEANIAIHAVENSILQPADCMLSNARITELWSAEMRVSN